MLSYPFFFPYIIGMPLIEALNYKMYKWPRQLYAPLLFFWKLLKVVGAMLALNLFNSRLMYAGTSTPSEMLGKFNVRL